jgi:hypothetical protein
VVAAAVSVLMHLSGSGSPADAAAGGTHTAALWHDVAECLRTHGHPEIQDPSIHANGDPDFGTQGATVKRAIAAAAAAACRAQIAALPSAEHSRPPTTAELHQLVLFARCVREHGLSDWPDPGADGMFPLGQRVLSLGKTGIARYTRTCAHLLGGDQRIPIRPSSFPPDVAKPSPKADGQ